MSRDDGDAEYSEYAGGARLAKAGESSGSVEAAGLLELLEILEPPESSLELELELRKQTAFDLLFAKELPAAPEFNSMSRVPKLSGVQAGK